MSYIEEIIRPDETVRLIAKLHWIIYARGVMIMLMFPLIYWFAISETQDGLPFLTPALWAGEALGFLLIVEALARQATTEIVVTDRRTILKTGFIARRTIEMNMDKVESVDVSQSVMGRILDFGDVELRGTGTGVAPLKGVVDPVAVRKAVTAN